VLAGPGFDFHEGQAVAVAKDQVDLTSVAGKVCGQEFKTLVSKVGLSRAFTDLPMDEMTMGRWLVDTRKGVVPKAMQKPDTHVWTSKESECEAL
jgi:hypothetical protein